MPADKRHFLEQLAGRLRETAEVARRAEEEAREVARSGATESEKREDARVLLEFGSLATGQSARVRRAREDLNELAAFTNRGLPAFGPDTPIALGALVDVSIESEDGDTEERTFFLLPVGAGTELTGPGGDGFLSVITPASPVGKALLGRRVGDSVEVFLRGEVRIWTVLDVS